MDHPHKRFLAVVGIQESLNLIRETCKTLEARGHTDEAASLLDVIDDIQRSIGRVAVDIDGETFTRH